MTAGQLIAFNALLAYFLTPLQNLVNLQPMLQSAIVASQRLGEILDLETEEEKHKGKKNGSSTSKRRYRYTKC
ncbi:hypothetical protein OL548_03495 [Lysinibacillus sp. MHQ-1]|nr:hypothetical protein OL548_03495 [Lysinibacillus sp. MHQ-1]